MKQKEQKVYKIGETVNFGGWEITVEDGIVYIETNGIEKFDKIYRCLTVEEDELNPDNEFMLMRITAENKTEEMGFLHSWIIEDKYNNKYHPEIRDQICFFDKYSMILTMEFYPNVKKSGKIVFRIPKYIKEPKLKVYLAKGTVVWVIGQGRSR